MTLINFSSYDTSSHARSGDPRTSHEAARTMKTLVARLIATRMVELLETYGPMGGEELELRMTRDPDLGGQVSPSGLRTRRVALVRAGIIRDSGRTNTTSRGCRETVWELVPSL